MGMFLSLYIKILYQETRSRKPKYQTTSHLIIIIFISKQNQIKKKLDRHRHLHLLGIAVVIFIFFFFTSPSSSSSSSRRHRHLHRRRRRPCLHVVVVVASNRFLDLLHPCLPFFQTAGEDFVEKLIDLGFLMFILKNWGFGRFF